MEIQKHSIIYGAGEYPIGSSARRLRMWHRALKHSGIYTRLIIAHPSPAADDVKNSEDFVHFMLEPHSGLDSEALMTRNYKHIFGKISGLWRALKFIKAQNEKLDFILLYGGGFFEGFMLMRLCKTHGMQFFVERTDENRRRYKSRKNIYDYLAIAYEDLFEKYIIPRCDTLFVVSAYLEDKFHMRFPYLKIKRTVPSMIDLDEFYTLQQKSLSDLNTPGIEIFASKKIKFLFAGSCIFTNGLKFFLKNAAELIRQGHDFEIIFIVFKGHIREIKVYVAELGITDHFTLIENILPDYIPACYKHADVLVMPEMGKEVANAGFPGKTAEYLAVGVPIITTDFSNIKDVLTNGENCVMSPIGDDGAYQANLKQLLGDVVMRETIGRKAVKSAKQFFDYRQSIRHITDDLRQKNKEKFN